MDTGSTSFTQAGYLRLGDLHPKEHNAISYSRPAGVRVWTLAEDGSTIKGIAAPLRIRGRYDNGRMVGASGLPRVVLWAVQGYQGYRDSIDRGGGCYLWKDMEISNLEEGRALNLWLIGL